MPELPVTWGILQLNRKFNRRVRGGTRRGNKRLNALRPPRLFFLPESTGSVSDGQSTYMSSYEKSDTFYHFPGRFEKPRRDAERDNNPLRPSASSAVNLFLP
jgi:hypothetical protein